MLLKHSLLTMCMVGVACMVLHTAPRVVTAMSATTVVHAETDSRYELFRGMVKDINQTNLTITEVADETQETRFRLTEDTKYFKDGKEAEADDVNAGAQVAVKATQPEEGIYQAGEVNVIR